MSEPDHDYETAAWEVWYDDAFDYDAPDSVDVRGQGLKNGLMELWARYLYETVQKDGSQGFSQFWLKREGGIVDLKREWKDVSQLWEGSKKLREWTFGQSQDPMKGYVGNADIEFLRRLCEAHLRRIQEPEAAEWLLARAAESGNREEFLGKIL
jgi:hypothetical protein